MDILIIDCDTSTRRQLTAILDGQYSFKVAACVKSTEEALSYLSAMRVDLAILDLGPSSISYTDAVNALKNACPDLRIMVFTAHADDQTIFTALKAGAIGFLLKSATPARIVSAIEEIQAGGSPLSPSVARRVLLNYQRKSNCEAGLRTVSPLSDREAEILTLLYQGNDLAQIADHLCISLHTVRVHTKKIYSKLNVNSRSSAIFEALQKNLIALDRKSQDAT